MLLGLVVVVGYELISANAIKTLFGGSIVVIRPHHGTAASNSGGVESGRPERRARRTRRAESLDRPSR